MMIRTGASGKHLIKIKITELIIARYPKFVIISR